MKIGTFEEFFLKSSIRIETPWNPGFNPCQKHHLFRVLAMTYN
jgi:hypothetical protein